MVLAYLIPHLNKLNYPVTYKAQFLLIFFIRLSTSQGHIFVITVIIEKGYCIIISYILEQITYCLVLSRKRLYYSALFYPTNHLCGVSLCLLISVSFPE